jgi:hypothetical protein
MGGRRLYAAARPKGPKGPKGARKPRSGVPSTFHLRARDARHYFYISLGRRDSFFLNLLNAQVIWNLKKAYRCDDSDDLISIAFVNVEGKSEALNVIRLIFYLSAQL